jgi:hypothetical protein
VPWNWDAPPGASTKRSTARKLIVSFLIGILSMGVAWAGTGLVPISAEDGSKSDASVTVSQQDGTSTASVGEGTIGALNLETGQVLGGAAKVSLFPRPEDYQSQFPGAKWEQDYAKCQTLPPPEEDPGYPEKLARAVAEGASHIADFRVRWAENPNCLYMGGYGIGPMFPITKWDNEYGLWTRSVAMQDAEGDTVVVTLIDAVYWEAHYDSLCPTDPCGFIDLANQLADELKGTYPGVKPESFIFASTHSHTAMDFIGGWGAVPKWYMQQATDSLKASVTQALASLEPAVLDAGEAILRARNGERRDFYRSAEDDTLSWFRLIEADNQPSSEVCTTPSPSPSLHPSERRGPPPGRPKGPPGRPSPSPSPSQSPEPIPSPICEPASPGRAIATVGAYSAHPVTEDHEGGEGDADFPAVFAKNVEDRFGGVGMFLQTGLGNMSPRGNKIEMGNGLADPIPAIGGGTQVTDPNVRVARKFWDQPVTNVPLGSLGVAGFFDRTFNKAPATITVGKSGFQNQKCNSASPVSVKTSVSGAKIGSLWITGGPGELFSNLTNTIEERNPGGVTLALGLVNDGLGYIVQEFETDYVGRQGTGFVGGPLAEYEDAYSIDHCIGDASLEYTLEILGQI